MEPLAGLIAFTRTAQLRSFTAAGRALGLSGSAVAKSVSRLEAKLGVRLLNRTTRSVSLTDDGAIFLEHSQRALAAIEETMGSLSASRSEPRGTLRIDLPVVIGRERIVPALPRLLARHPALSLDVRLADRWTPIVEEGIDAVVRVGAIADSRLVARRLGEQRLVVVGSPAYLDAHGTPRRPADLDDHAFVLFRMPTSGRPRPWQLVQRHRRLEWRPRGRVLMDEGEAVVRAAEAGLGLAQVPDYMVVDAVARGTLVTLLDGHRPEPMPISVAYPHARQVSPKVRAFVDFLVQEAGTIFAPALPVTAQAAATRLPRAKARKRSG